MDDYGFELEDNAQILWFGADGSVRVEGNSYDEEEELPSNNEWIKDGDTFYPTKDTKVIKKLPPGYYDVGVNQGKYFVSKKSINTDELMHLPDADIDKVVTEIERFWKKADLFKSEGYIHKRGVMFHGKPGCGKTSTITLLSKEVIKNGGLVFYVRSSNDLAALINFVNLYLRDIQPETPIVVIVEDIDKLVQQNESLLLNWLSGEDEFDHCVVVATTNRVDDLNDLLLRPTRFDWVVEMKSPSDESRELYLKTKNLDESEVATWVKATKDFTIAQLKEVYIAVKLLDNDFDSVIKKLKDQEKNIKISTYNPIRESIGFGKK